MKRAEEEAKEEQRGDGPKHGAHPSRFFGRGMFLTLLPQGASAAIANASSIQDAQRAIMFKWAFLRVERAISGAAQRSIGLQRKR